jgi:hypothetical protein
MKKTRPNQKLKQKSEVKAEETSRKYKEIHQEIFHPDTIEDPLNHDGGIGCDFDGMSEYGYSKYLAAESWHPCFNGGFIAVGIHKPNLDGTVKISVIGADDTCMMKMCSSYENAREIVKRFPIILSMDYLSSVGFIFD